MFLRMHNLGQFGFWIDELFHAIGARSVLETGSPVIPGMLVYERAYPITAITAFFFENFGIQESIGRTPSVIAGGAFLVAGYFLVRRLFDSSLALLFTFMMAFSPLEILWDRQVRMYSLFRLLYFSAAVLFYLGFEADDSGRTFQRPPFLRRIEQGLEINLIVLGFSGLLFYVSTKIHLLSYNFIFVLLAYCCFMFLTNLQKHGMQSAFSSKYILLVSTMFGGAIFIRVYSPGFYHSALNVIKGKPFWDTYGLDFRYYLRYLWDNYPLLFLIYPAGIWSLVSRYGKKGVYVFCSFAPLFLMHMFLYANDINERYILYIFPFFSIGSVSFIDFLLKKGANLVKDLWSRERIGGAFVYSSVMIFLLGVASYPWVGLAFEVPRKPHFDDWKSVVHELTKIPGDSVIISTRRMPLYFYHGKNPDYVVIKSFEDLIEKEIRVPSRRRPLFMDVKWVFSSKDLEKIIEENGKVYFISDERSYWNPAFLDDALRRSISGKMKIEKHDGDQRILIFKKIPMVSNHGKPPANSPGNAA